MTARILLNCFIHEEKGSSYSGVALTILICATGSGIFDSSMNEEQRQCSVKNDQTSKALIVKGVDRHDFDVPVYRSNPNITPRFEGSRRASTINLPGPSVERRLTHILRGAARPETQNPGHRRLRLKRPQPRHS